MTGAAVDVRELFCVHRTADGDAAALQGATLTVGAGETLCVLGPSGAGKSTLLRVIAGLQTPSAGIVCVLGRDIGRLPARARGRLRHSLIGFLGQRAELQLSPDLSIAQAIELPLAVRGRPRGERRRRAQELLDATGLGDRCDSRPSELSGGERQRAALCSALAHRPKLLLADEPTGELDATSAAAVLELIVGLARAEGTTVIIVSHDQASAEVADRSVRIRDGRIVEDRRNGRDTFVVGRTGWLQLPGALLARAGIAAHATARAVEGGVLIAPAGPADGAVPSEAAARAAPGPGVRPASLELRSVSRGRGLRAARRIVLDNLSLRLAEGRMTAITGRSGSGKTTLLRLLAALDSPDAGQLRFDGLEIGDWDQRRRARLRRERIGYLSQEPAPVPFLSSVENVALALRLRGCPAAEASERAAVALSRVGLAERARQRVSRLSAGEGQRVALARALASARGLLVVDEPTSRLDTANAASVAELLATCAEREGQTVICATHDPEVIRRAHEVIALGAGRG